MTRLLFSLFCLVLLTQIKAQVIEDINITGNKKFSEKKYLEWIDISEGAKYFPGIEDSIFARISNNLRQNYYFHFTIDKPVLVYTTDSLSLNISIFLDESSPTFLSKFIITGMEKADSTLILDRIEFLREQPFDPVLLNFELDEIIAIYEEKGFPFARFSVNNILFNKGESAYDADIYISFSKEKLSTIDKIVIEGNDKTNSDVIIRELRIHNGEVYNQEKIDEIPAVLNRLRFFQPVASPQFYFDNSGNGILKIGVSEKETNNFDGIVGYVPAGNDKQDGFFTGYINVSLRNLFGTGRALGILWEKKERLSQELRLRYLEPWVFSFPMNISGELYQRKQDTTYINQKYSMEFEYLANEIITAGFNLSTESTIPTDNESTRFTVYNSSSLTTGFSFKLDTSDDFYAPRRGVVFINSYSYSRKKINGPEEFINPDTKTNLNLQRIEVNFYYFLELFRRQVIALKLQGRELKGDFFEVSDLYPLGGTNSLRGYRERQFLGNRTFWSNLEYRYLLTSRTYAFLFFDTGYFLRNEDLERAILRQSDFKTGFGFGLNLETGLGVLGVSYALGEGDSFSTGKLHFGIINEF